jgi:uncharacterized membrane protein
MCAELGSRSSIAGGAAVETPPLLARMSHFEGNWTGRDMATRWGVAAFMLLLSVAPGRAGTMRCSFTEPFFSIIFESATGKVTVISPEVTDPDSGKPVPEVLAEHARVVPADPPGDGMSFRLVNGSETILELKLTGKGSDGMSENLFPFEAWRGRHDGGCETDRYPAFETYELLEDLGVTP